MKKTWVVDGDLDLWTSLRFSLPLDRALVRRDGDAVEYGLWTDEGPAAVRVEARPGELSAAASGPGAAVSLEAVPRTVGLDDDPSAFHAQSPLLRDLHRRHRGFRLGSTGRVFDVVLPTVLGQRVTTDEAKRSFHRLVLRVSARAPGGTALYLPPRPESVAGLSLDDFHELGVEQARARVVREAARRAARLEEIIQMAREEAVRRLQAVAGIGSWTAGWVMGSAWGDRDAVPVGDFHLPNTVAWALAGEPRGTDERMLELLDPYRPQRRRALLLIKMSGLQAPRYGPRSPKSIISRRGPY